MECIHLAVSVGLGKAYISDFSLKKIKKTVLICVENWYFNLLKLNKSKLALLKVNNL